MVGCPASPHLKICPAQLQPPFLPTSPHVSLDSDLPSAPHFQLSREPPPQLKPAGIKHRGAISKNQGSFSTELSQAGSWLPCPLAPGSSPFPSGTSEIPRHCHGDPDCAGALQRHSSWSSQTNKAIPAKALLPGRSLNELRVGTAGEQKQDC